MHAMRSLLAVAGLLATLPASVQAQTNPPTPAESAAPKSGWNLRLVPKAFQQNPDLAITVISETSEAGKKRPVVSAEAPVYYLFQSGGYQERGEPLSQKPFPESDVKKILQRALAASGYFPATPEHAPSIVVVYTWGAHNVISPENAISEGQVIRNVLDRAAVAGGDKFAAELAQAFRDSNAIAEASARPLGAGSQQTADLGAAASMAQINALTDPVRLFKNRSPKNDFLVSQASSNCYYLIASAFDYESLASPQRQLLWRTRMTVNADGISQIEAIPTMITAATPYLGRDLTESAIIRKPAVSKGQVEIGTPTRVEGPPNQPAEKK
jgi:hypothetical protein